MLDLSFLGKMKTCEFQNSIVLSFDDRLFSGRNNWINQAEAFL